MTATAATSTATALVPAQRRSSTADALQTPWSGVPLHTTVRAARTTDFPLLALVDLTRSLR
jgi:hypothetical protein